MVEDFDDWIAGWRIQCILDVSDAEEENEKEAEGHGAIDDDCEDQDLGDGCGGFADFFAHVHGSVETCDVLALSAY